ncbi:glycosyltransferase [Algoriphagus halophilus]|uniref:Glycosyltransferase involved in cell wall bisynthesis n=1 Tax=Algoriphagus halophilus TaxID=226505 RepID=A0A1N6DSK4_9BACT|nr:glycosyltransferase [Algoriphagus halophilus]SIN73677.1 Glycosyltransferase involved in cell wall bisynthesis [Algoriphagus halophilus]
MGQSKASKIPVLIASSLKPLKDTRAWEKLGNSLRESNKYTLNIIGFSSKIEESIAEVRFFPSLSNRYSTWERFFSQFRFLKTLVQTRPKILIVCTYEYLASAALLKVILGYKLIYDVQENYVLNLKLNPDLSNYQRSNALRIIQNLESIKGVDCYFLAEACYVPQMPEKKPFLILENKFAGNIVTGSRLDYSEKRAFQFLISGTITPAFGTIQGIQFFKQIQQIFPNSRLIIIGHTPLHSFRKKLEMEVGSHPGIELKITDTPVDHEEIVKEIIAADFCLLPYQSHEAISSKMPTKLFEAMALHTPVLISPNEKWKAFIDQYQGGTQLDFDSMDVAIAQFLAAIKNPFFINQPGEEVLWSSQEGQMLSCLEQLLSF